MKSTRRTTRLSVLVLAEALASACASVTESHLAAAKSAASDGGALEADASRGAACGVGNGQEGSQYKPCVGHNDASRGSCSAGEMCGSMPDVGYDYCMLTPPCPTGMVSVINLACAYPCDDASACAEHGLARCAENTLAEFTGGPFGWCTPPDAAAVRRRASDIAAMR